ncbi:MAG: hypothetical protein ACRDNW_25755, partial [Trebonia sp.]
RLISEQTGRRITVNAFNPGAMSDTGFSRPSGNILVRGAVRVIGGVMGALVGKQSTSIESGAALASLVTDPSLAAMTGRYVDRGVEVESSPLSYDRDNAGELWQASMAMSGLGPSETIFISTKEANHGSGAILVQNRTNGSRTARSARQGMLEAAIVGAAEPGYARPP